MLYICRRGGRSLAYVSGLLSRTRILSEYFHKLSHVVLGAFETGFATSLIFYLTTFYIRGELGKVGSTGEQRFSADFYSGLRSSTPAMPYLELSRGKTLQLA